MSQGRHEGRRPRRGDEPAGVETPTLKGRKFYGIFRETPEGEEYYACVAKVDADDPVRMSLEVGIIHGGKFVRRRVQDWESVIRAGQLPGLFRELELATRTKRTRPVTR